jgi:hypothetical protein
MFLFICPGLPLVSSLPRGATPSVDLESAFGKFPLCHPFALWQHAHRGREECVGETVFGPKVAGEKEGFKEPTPH